MMHQQQHPDLLGSEGHKLSIGESTNGYQVHVSYWTSDIDLCCIDAELRPLPQYDVCSNAPQDCSSEARYSYTAYDPVAHGFGHPSFQRSRSESVLYPTGVSNVCIDYSDWNRHMRYSSPTLPAGMALSSNESSVGDYALSPDMGESSQDVLLHYIDSEFEVSSFGLPEAADHTWTSDTSGVPPFSSTPVPTYQGSLSMRDLQVTPDPEGEDDELLDARDFLHARIPLPEELELSEEVASPADSGLGQSIDEQIQDGEDDWGAQESDNHGHEPVLTSRPRRRCVTNPRHSWREGTPLAAGPIDGRSRVHKSSSSRPGVHVGHARSKFKRMPFSRTSSTSKSFPCAFHHYGCRAAFASKNEWKRHVSSQHLQLGYYRCDLGNCSPEVAGARHRGYNDFNRKDLFTQHCRRMHAPWLVVGKGEDGASKKERDNFEKQLEDIRARCWVDSRKPPVKSRCGFCDQDFVDRGEGKAWEQRMEHVGRHLERDGLKIEQEQIDEGLQQWALAEGVIQAGKTKGAFWLVGHEPTTRRLDIRSHRRSGRLVGRTQVEEESDHDVDVEDGSSASDSDDSEDSIDVPMKSGEDSEDDAEGEDE